MDELYDEEHEANVYGEAAREDLEENDEISPEEEAFMQGYENYEEEEDEDEEEETQKEE